MTRLFARVRSPAEADAVERAGFDGIAVDGVETAGTSLALLRPGASATDLVLASPGSGPLAMRLFRDTLPDEATLAAAATDGMGGILVGSSGRLLDATNIADLEALRARCRSRRLLCGFSGGLEPPDLPRLLACTPDVLVVGQALRQGRAMAGALDPAALRLVRDLVPAAEPAIAARTVASRPDRIFLRDLVLRIAIGAYDSERGRLQRVRFAIEADLVETGRASRDMRDVVSYDLFTDTIHALTSGRHVDFVETLAEEIAARILTHPRVCAIRVTVEKLDVGPGAVGVSIDRARSPGAGPA